MKTFFREIRSVATLRASAFLAVAFFLCIGSGHAADSYTINHGQTLVIEEHGECRVVTNNHPSGQSIWVPTKTAQEWQSYQDHAPPSTVSVACDRTPDAFAFNDVTLASLSTLTTPMPPTVTITGINAPTPVFISGQGSPQISINGGGWVTSGTIENGQTLAARLTSAASGSTAYAATINVGGITDNWSVTTADTTPDAFSFNDVTGAGTSTLTTPSPASVTITGINASTPVSVSGQGSPQIRIAGGSWVTSGNITNGQTLAVRLTSAAGGGTAYSATVNVGGVTDNWSVTTAVDCTTGPIGTQCPDGAWYTGTTVGGARMYVAHQPIGGVLTWKTTRTVTAGAYSNTDGLANTNAIIAAGAAQHNAAKACRDKGASWYLPARDEVTVIIANAASTLQAAGWLGGGTQRWTSTQFPAPNDANFVYERSTYLPSNTSDSTNGNYKDSTSWALCVRR